MFYPFLLDISTQLGPIWVHYPKEMAIFYLLHIAFLSVNKTPAAALPAPQTTNFNSFKADGGNPCTCKIKIKSFFP